MNNISSYDLKTGDDTLLTAAYKRDKQTGVLQQMLSLPLVSSATSDIATPKKVIKPWSYLIGPTGD